MLPDVLSELRGQERLWVCHPLPGWGGIWGRFSGGVATLNHRLLSGKPPACAETDATGRTGAETSAQSKRFARADDWPRLRGGQEGGDALDLAEERNVFKNAGPTGRGENLDGGIVLSVEGYGDALVFANAIFDRLGTLLATDECFPGINMFGLMKIAVSEIRKALSADRVEHIVAIRDFPGID